MTDDTGGMLSANSSSNPGPLSDPALPSEVPQFLFSFLLEEPFMDDQDNLPYSINNQEYDSRAYPMQQYSNPIFAAADIDELAEAESSNKCIGVLADVCVEPRPQCLVIRYDISQADLCCKVLRTSNLTHLEITQSRGSWLLQVYTSQWLFLLSKQPSLQMLVLDGYNINARDNAPLSPTRQISLPNLRVLHYTSEIANCNDFFGHLILPPSCNVNLFVDHNTRLEDTSLRGLRDGVTRFLNIWVPELGEGHFAPFRHFQWEITIGKQWMSIAITEVSNSPEYYEEPRFTLNYEINNEEDVESEYSEGPSSLVSALFSLLEHAGSSVLVHETTINLHVSHELSTLWNGDEGIRPTLRSFLSSFKFVRGVILLGERVEDICDHLLHYNPLITTTAPPSLARTDKLLFPYIQDISIHASPDECLLLRIKLDNYLRWRVDELGDDSWKPVAELTCDDYDGIQSNLRFHSSRCENCYTQPQASSLKEGENGRVFRQYYI